MTLTADWSIDGHIRLPCGPPASTGPSRNVLRPIWQSSTDAHDLLGACHSLLADGDLAAAEEVLAAAERRGLPANLVLAMAATLSWLKGDWPALHRLSQQVIATSASPSALDFLALATACRNLNDIDGAARAAAQALKLEPAQIEAAFIAVWAASERGDGEAMLACYRQLEKSDPGNARWMIEIVRVLQHLGRARVASSAMEAALARAPGNEMLWNWALGYGYRTAEQARRAQVPEAVLDGFSVHLRHAPEDVELRRPLMVDVFGSDVVVAPAQGSKTLVLVFTGGSDSMSMPLPVFDRFLAAAGLSAVYLKDFQRLMYLEGVASLGEGLPSTVAALRQLQQRLGATRLCTVGDSAGGFAAIRYAVELDADCALSFGGDTHWSPGRGEFALFANHLRAHSSIEAMDLRAFLAARTECARIVLVFGAEELRDKAHAEHLSGLPRVELWPLPGQNTHNIAGWLAMNGCLGETLGRAIAARADDER